MSDNEFTFNSEKKTEEMHLSDQALGAVMMALQKSLLEQTDIVPVLKNFKLAQSESGDLVVVNPPVFKMNHSDVDVLANATETKE
jgi:hypothetical protein